MELRLAAIARVSRRQRSKRRPRSQTQIAVSATIRTLVSAWTLPPIFVLRFSPLLSLLPSRCREHPPSPTSFSPARTWTPSWACLHLREFQNFFDLLDARRAAHPQEENQFFNVLDRAIRPSNGKCFLRSAAWLPLSPRFPGKKAPTFSAAPFRWRRLSRLCQRGSSRAACARGSPHRLDSGTIRQKNLRRSFPSGP